MSVNNMNYRKPLLAKIHIAKKELGLDDDLYRDVLVQLTGKRSCTQMNNDELVDVLNSFKRKGFKTKRTMSERPIKRPILKKLVALWKDMHKEGIVKDGSLKSLDAFARKVMNGKDDDIWILNINSLDDRRAIVVIECLKKWRARIKNNK